MRLLVAMMLLIGAAPGLEADEIDLWIGFSGVQTQSIAASTEDGRRQGQVKFVDVLVGSNETREEAKVHQLEVALSVMSAQGRCSASSEITTKVKPAANILRFQVFYPEDSTSSSLVEYMLRASLRNSPDPKGSVTNNRKDFAFTLPAGGMPPTCVKLK